MGLTDAAGRERELLPCPFCGVAPALNKFPEYGSTQISCENDACPIQPHTEYSGRDQVPEWNARAPSGLAGRQQTTEQEQDLAHSGSEKVAAAARNETPEGDAP